MAGRSMRLIARSPATMVSAFFVPVVLLLVVTASFAKVVAPTASYGDFVDRSLPLFAMMGILFSAVSTGLSAHRDLHSGIDARFRTLPMAPSAPLIGGIVADAGRNLVTLLVIGLVGAALGFRADAGLVAAVAGVGVALLFGMAVTWLAVAVAVRAGSAEAAASGMNALFLVLSFLSSGFVPIADLPGWAQPIARHSPVSATIDAMRALTQGGPTAGPVIRSVVWALGGTVVLAVIAVRSYRRKAS